jgi:16S rRNA (guanine527-N7)-methyltransferase
VEPAWLRARLREPAEQFGVDLDAPRAARLAEYATRLLAWGRRINLTGARDAATLVEAHLADALALMPDLHDVEGRVVDVGSGGGLPGLVLAVLRPDLDVLLLEPIGKKHAFLRSMIRELGLGRTEARRERLEEARARPDFALADAAVSRATFPLPEWLGLGLELVRPGGRVLGLEGVERTMLPAPARRRPYRRPGSTAERAVVRIDRPSA